MSKVVITDYTFPDLSIETQILEAAGLEVASGQCKTQQELVTLVADADYVITQFAPIDEDVIKSMPSFFASRRARGVAIIRPCLFLETEERWGVTGSTSGWRDGS